jgi:hypothetical protein
MSKVTALFSTLQEPLHLRPTTQDLFFFNMQSEIVKKFLDEEYYAELSALGSVREARNTVNYTALVARFLTAQEGALKEGLSCDNLLRLSSKELQARLELLSGYRAEGSAAPSGMKLVDCCNEYALLLQVLCESKDGLEFVAKDFTSAEGQVVCGAQVAPGETDEERERRRVRERLALLQEERRLQLELAKQQPPAQEDPLSTKVAELRKQLAAKHLSGGRGDPKPSRAKDLSEVLDVSAGALGLKDRQLSAMSAFLSNSVSGGVGGGDALSLLLPNTHASTSDSAALAAELVRGALSTKAQNRRHASYEEFERAIHRAIAKARTSDPSLAVQLAEHLRHVTQLAMRYTWKDAEQYHWDVMVRLEDGHYDLSRGGDAWSLAQLQLTMSQRKVARSKGAEASSYNKETAKYCEQHGWCAHATPDCKLPPGQKAKNFRETK